MGGRVDGKDVQPCARHHRALGREHLDAISDSTDIRRPSPNGRRLRQVRTQHLLGRRPLGWGTTDRVLLLAVGSSSHATPGRSVNKARLVYTYGARSSRDHPLRKRAVSLSHGVPRTGTCRRKATPLHPGPPFRAVAGRPSIRFRGFVVRSCGINIANQWTTPTPGRLCGPAARAARV